MADLNNPFKELDEGEAELPPQLKGQVVGTYGLIRTVFKVLELFLGNISKTVAGLIKTVESNSNFKNPEDS